MRPPCKPSLRHGLWQAGCFGAGLLRTRTRRHARHAFGIFSRIGQSYRPAYLPLYAMAGIIGFAVVLLVMTAWLRVVMPEMIGSQRTI
jgi:hypothetical protein